MCRKGVYRNLNSREFAYKVVHTRYHDSFAYFLPIDLSGVLLKVDSNYGADLGIGRLVGMHVAIIASSLMLLFIFRGITKPQTH